MRGPGFLSPRPLRIAFLKIRLYSPIRARLPIHRRDRRMLGSGKTLYKRASTLHPRASARTRRPGNPGLRKAPDSAAVPGVESRVSGPRVRPSRHSTLARGRSAVSLVSWIRAVASASARAPVAQLDRVPDYESEGWRFEPARAHQDRVLDLFTRSSDPNRGSPPLIAAGSSDGSQNGVLDLLTVSFHLSGQIPG
jgi:hypothetical protein